MEYGRESCSWSLEPVSNREKALQRHPIDSQRQNGLEKNIGKIAPESPSLIKVINIKELKYITKKDNEGMNFADQSTSPSF